MEKKKMKLKLWQIVLLVFLVPITIGALLPEQYESDNSDVTLKSNTPVYEISSKEDVSYSGCSRYNYYIEVPITYSKEDVLLVLEDMEKVSKESDIISVFIDYEGNQTENRLNMGYGIGTNGNCDSKTSYNSKFIESNLK